MIYKSFVFTSLFVILFACVFSQNAVEISGKVVANEDKNAIFRATINLKNDAKVVAYGFSDINGQFKIVNSLLDTGLYFIEVSHIFFSSAIDSFRLDGNNSSKAFIFHFSLLPSSKELEEVAVFSKPAIKEKNDTIEYNAEAFKTISTRKVEDLLKNMDGFAVGVDGKISYRGKPVKALLIDDEDMTRADYGVLTKNLNAALVDKVQVFDNYSENSVIGSVLKSGEVAVNLQLDQRIKNAVSTMLSLGLGAGNKLRHEVDGNIIYLATQLKLIELINANSIAGKEIFADNNFEHYFYQDEEAVVTISDKYLKRTRTEGVFGNGGFSNTYTRNNNDALSSTLAQIRISNGIKLNARLDAAYRQNQLQASQDLILTPELTTKWETQTDKSNWQKNRSVNGLGFFNHDNQRNFAGTFNLGFRWSDLKDQYKQFTDGYFIDSLKSRGKIDARNWQADYTAYLKLNSKSLLKAQTAYRFQSGTEHIDLLTNRFSAYFGMDEDSIYSYAQHLPLKRNILSNQVSWIRNTNQLLKSISLLQQLEWVTGSVQNSMGNVGEYLQKGSLRNQSNDYKGNRQQLLAIEVKGERRFSKRLNFKAKFIVGMNKVRSPFHPNNNFLPIWQWENDLIFGARNFKNWGINLSSIQNVPALTNFYPDTLIADFYSISIVPETIRITRVHQMGVNYSTYNLYKGTSLFANGWVKYVEKGYQLSYVLDPRISIHQLQQVDDLKNAGGLVSFKQFIFPLKLNLLGSIMVNIDDGKNFINANWVDVFSTNWNYSLKLVTDTKKEISGEFGFYQNRFRFIQNVIGGELVSKSLSTQWQAKIRYQPISKFYVGMDYSLFKTPHQTMANMYDVYSTWMVSAKLSLDLKVHNLMNEKENISEWATAYSYTRHRFSLINRYVFLRANFKF